MSNQNVMLIVDDIEINRAILAQFFQEDYVILEAENGKAAFDIIETRPVDIIMLDLVMPVMNGMELLAVLHKTEKFCNIPVVVTTSQGAVSSEAQAMEMGAADFITKPYNPTIVRCRVHNVMARLENEWRKLEQAAQNNQIRKMRRTIELDALTGVYNQEAFNHLAEKMIQENHNTKYCIVYFDIYSFKIVNELFNSETGDMVLQTAAAYFRTVVGKRGIAGRIIADRFAICLPRELLDMELLMQGLDGVMSSLSMYRRMVFYAGVYYVDNVYLSVNQMIDRAYMALSQIKGKPGERFSVYDEKLRMAMVEEQMIVREMELALESHQFTMYMQPIYDATTNMPVGLEALARWQHPSKGVMSPKRFMNIFEKNGFITRLDRFIWEEACRFIGDQRDRGLEIKPVSVNVSRLNMYDTSFVDALMTLVRRFDISPKNLMLEITEEAYMENPQQLLKVMKKLQKSGFKVVMDNFGKGHSSMNMLNNLPVDILKMDLSFLKGSERAKIIIRSMVKLANDLDMEVVAEGVEDQELADFVRSVNCRLAQGYYYSQVMTKGACMEMLENLN